MRGIDGSVLDLARLTLLGCRSRNLSDPAARLNGMEQPPEKSTARELAEQAVVAGVGMVPIAGSPLAVAFAMAMGWTFNKRMRQWLEDLAESVTELQERDELPTVEELAESDVFVDAVVNATRAAQTTHQEMKLEALKNAVLNSLAATAPDVDEQARFFRLIEEFTPAHLRLLTFLHDPGAAFDAAGEPRPDIPAGSRRVLLEAVYRDFTGRGEWYDLLANDLAAGGLIQGSIGGMMTGAGLWAPMTTALGGRFLGFVTR